MSFVEQPDRIGSTILISIVVWGGVALAALGALKLAFPEHALKRAEPVSSCKASVPLGPYDAAKTTDPARPVLLAPSRCSVPPSSDPKEALHAYLEGAELDSSPTEARPPIDAALLAHGTALYKQHCAACHGETGDGKGPDSCALEIPPAVHKNGVFALRTTEHEALPTDEDLFRTITRGVHGTAMPPWFVLPERDRWALVAHVKSLSKQFEEDVAPPPIEPGHAPEASADRIAAGRALYASRGCASCHGDTGHGNGPAAESLTVRPRNFTNGRFHRGSSVADIHETLLTGLDGTPMASFVKVMSEDEMWNVSLFVHSISPPMAAHGNTWCPEAPKALDTQEVLGIRNLMHTTQPVGAP